MARSTLISFYITTIGLHKFQGTTDSNPREFPRSNVPHVHALRIIAPSVQTHLFMFQTQYSAIRNDDGGCRKDMAVVGTATSSDHSRLSEPTTTLSIVIPFLNAYALVLSHCK